MAADATLVTENLSYDPGTGIITWRNDRARGIKSGALAGFDNGNGYRRIEISGVRFYAHQAAWVFLTGKWPAREIDHINGDRSDNRAVNLRECDRFSNNQNTSGRAHRLTPYKGIKRNRTSQKWIAKIRAFNKVYYLGTFDTPELAHQAYVSASHKLHGAFARAE